MSRPTVYAVMRVTLEVPVRPSHVGETFEQMFECAKNEAESIVRKRLGEDGRVISAEFSHATVKGGA